LLDEPTNDLDTDTLAALEDLLDGFAGTLVVVSHDRYLLERVCDRQMAMLGDADIRDLPGGVEEYLSLRAAAGTSAGSALTGASAAASASSSPRPGGGAPAQSAAQSRAARKDMAKLERTMERLARKEAQLHDQMAAAATEHAAVLALDAELRAVTTEREQVEEEWLAAAEILG
jgi:ABC-type multidrug transport system ATPase subunit